MPWSDEDSRNLGKLADRFGEKPEYNHGGIDCATYLGCAAPLILFIIIMLIPGGLFWLGDAIIAVVATIFRVIF